MNPQPPPAPQGRGQPYQFTSEELRVLKECNRDSFFQRCLPMGTLLGIATYYSVQTGYLNPSPRWGATPKVIAASILGYFIGKISYQQKCAEKIMQLPDSRLGAILRQKKRTTSFQESLSPFSNVSSEDVYSDIEQHASGEIDGTRPDYSGLDDYHRPTVDSNPIFEEETMPVQQNKTTTYEELRKQNREEYQKQRSSVYKDIPSLAEVPPIRRVSPISSDQDSTSTPSLPRKTNIYGDIIE